MTTCALPFYDMQYSLLWAFTPGIFFEHLELRFNLLLTFPFFILAARASRFLLTLTLAPVASDLAVSRSFLPVSRPHPITIVIPSLTTVSLHSSHNSFKAADGVVGLE